MKNLIAMLLLLSGLTIAGCQSDSGEPVSSDLAALEKYGSGQSQDGFVGGPIRFLSSELELTDEQVDQICSIFEEERRTLCDQFGGSRRDLSNEEWMELRKERHAYMMEKISPVLTEEQLNKLDELKTRLDNGDFPRPGMQTRLDQLTDELDLTADQRAKMEELFIARWEKMKSEGKAGRGRRGARQSLEEREAKFQEMLSELEGVLTPEQLEKFEELHNERIKNCDNRRGDRKGRGGRGGRGFNRP